MPNKAVEDDGDKRVFFGLREHVPQPSCILLKQAARRHGPCFPCLIYAFPHRASPLTFGYIATMNQPRLTIAALDLKDDRTLTLNLKYPDGTTSTVCGRWTAIDDQRMRFDFDTYPDPGQSSVVQSLLMRYRFEDKVMIHIPEQGPNKGKEIRLHRLNTRNAEQGRKR